MKWGRKNVLLSTENWPCLGNGERYGHDYLLISDKKWHRPCQIIWKLLTLDDLEVTDKQYGRLSQR